MAILILVLSSHLSVAQTIKLRVCMINSELFPLWRGPSQEEVPFPGLNITLQHHVLETLPVQVEWLRMPFARCLHNLALGDVDMLNAASFNNKRERYGVYPKKNGEIDVSRRLKFDSYYGFAHVDSNIKWGKDGFTGLPNLPVAVEIGASIVGKLQQHGLPLTFLPSPEYAFKMLAKNRVSAVVTNQYNGLKYTSDTIKRLEPAVQEKPYYLVFSKQFYQRHQALADAIWQRSGQLQQHTYQQVLQQYASLPEWP